MRAFQRLFTAAAVACAVTASVASTAPVAAAPAPSPWYQSGFNQSGTGYNPLESSLTSANVTGLHQAWFISAPGTGGSDLGAVDSVNGVGFFEDGGDHSLHAVNIATGATRWQVTVSGCPLVSAPPAVHLGVLVVSTQPCVSGRGYLTGYDLNTGRRLWKWRPGLNLSTPITFNGFVYDESLDPDGAHVRVAAINVHTGAVKWQLSLPPDLLNEYVLAADGSHLYLSSVSYLREINPSTGALGWVRSVAGGLNLLVSSGHVVVGGVVPPGTGLLTSYSPKGVRQWQKRLPCNEVAATPTELVTTNYSGTVQALALASGRPTWHQTFEGADLGSSQPAIAGGVVYVPGIAGSNPVVYALAAGTGAQLWSHSFAAGDETHVTVAAGTLLVSVNDGAGVTAFRP